MTALASRIPMPATAGREVPLAPTTPIPCANPRCLTQAGNRHVISLVMSLAATITMRCPFCHTRQTRVVLDGIVLD